MKNFLLILVMLSVFLNSFCAEVKHAGQKRKNKAVQAEQVEEKQEVENLTLAERKNIFVEKLKDENFIIIGDWIAVEQYVNEERKLIVFKIPERLDIPSYMITIDIKNLAYDAPLKFEFSKDLKYFVLGLSEDSEDNRSTLFIIVGDRIERVQVIPGYNPRFHGNKLIETTECFYDIENLRFTSKIQTIVEKKVIVKEPYCVIS